MGTLIGEESSAAELAVGGGKIVVGGYIVNNVSCWKPLLVRYDDNGHLDTTFGNGGTLVTTFGGCGTVGFDGEIRDVQIDATATHIIVTGSKGDATHAIVARYNWNGTFDQTFGIGGMVDLTVLAQNQGISSVSISSIRLSGSQIIAVGSGWAPTTGQNVLVARLNRTAR